MLPFGMFVYGEPRTAHTAYPESRRELRGEPRSAAHPRLILCGSLRAFSGEFVVAGLPCEVHPGAHRKGRCNLFRINTYETSRKCCNQRTYRIAKSFRFHTYKKQGGWGVLWLTNPGPPHQSRPAL